jgi:filamentous hemagglutinin
MIKQAEQTTPTTTRSAEPRALIGPAGNPGGSPHRGLTWVQETPTSRDLRVINYQGSAPSARSVIATRRPEVPALRFTNPNEAGQNLVRFDGMEGTVLIDRKLSVTTRPKQKDDLQRMAVALHQNPGYSGRIEVPNEREARRVSRILRELGINDVLSVRAVPES